MEIPITVTLITLLATITLASAEESASKPPAGVPSDAKLFNGKWYRVYLDQVAWPRARDKCKALGGQLAVVPDEPTHAFLKEFKPDVGLWLGATDEKLEGVWMWVDGTEMTFKAWAPKEPTGHRAENYLALIHGAWEDHSHGRPRVIGYICEWKAR